MPDLTDPRDPLIAASDDLADAIATLAMKVALDDPAEFIRGACESALRLTRHGRASGTFRVKPCHDDIGGFIIEDPAGEPVNVWYTTEDQAVSAASGLNRERLAAKAGFRCSLEVLNGGRAA